MSEENVSSQERPAPAGLRLLPAGDGWRLEGELDLDDRPGELAEVADLFAGHDANIDAFRYNRSENANRIRVGARIATARDAGELAGALRQRGCLDPREPREPDTPEIVAAEGLLRIKARLVDRPGTLAAFARVLRDHRANVIFMAYDGEEAPGQVEMAMATECADEVGALLGDLNERGYHYHVEWQGRDGASIDDAIGLSLVERFLLRLRSLLPRNKLDELHDLIRSSRDLRETLLRFKEESGRNGEALAASEVFTHILQLAAASVSKTGAAFSLRLTGPVRLTDSVSLHVLACPTGANAFLFATGDEYALLDSSYGLYYADVKAWLSAHGMDPSRIRRAYFTHADADHAGWAAFLEEDFGTEVYMHPDGAAVFEHENRAHGLDTRLLDLNGYYTKLINRFTDLRAPRRILPFPAAAGEAGGFPIVGQVEIGDLRLQVLESFGGHTPAQVFFYAPREGLIFCGDYLIDLLSLSDRTKSTLSIARRLMTSTNSDSRVFAQEMQALGRLMREAEARLRPEGKSARVFPGHGDFYSVAEADWLENGG